MKTRTNSIVRNVLTVIAGAVIIASPAMADEAKVTIIERQAETAAEPVGTNEGGVTIIEREAEVVVEAVEEVEVVKTSPSVRFEIADFNDSGTVDARDLHDFYFAWYFGKMEADINGNGELEASDVWMFMDIWSSTAWIIAKK